VGRRLCLRADGAIGRKMVVGISIV
jgi:hypothetical protein